MPTYLSPGVYVEEVESGSRPIEGVGTAVAAFVGLAEKGPINAATLVSNWKQFVNTFGEFTGEGYLAHAVYGYFLNGGGNAYIVRVGADAEAPKAETSLPSSTTTGDHRPPSRFTVKAIEAGPAGSDITVEVADASTPVEGEETFKIIVRKGSKPIEEFDNVTLGKGKTNVATAINTKSKVITITEQASVPAVRPANGTFVLTGSSSLSPVRVEASAYVGSAADRTGFGGLEAIEDITMVCAPDLMYAYQKGMIDKGGVKAVQAAMIAHCESMGDRVAVLDPLPDLNAQQILDWRMNGTGYDSKYAALYWPWVKVLDPATNSNILVPPSGHIAGVWGRNDDTRGVHKAPANEVIRGAVALGMDITAREQELLNPSGINCIRSFPGRGIRVWGARTLSSDPAWRYLNVRRLFNYIEESILGGTQWVVFEPNDDALWAKMRRTIQAFLTNEWRKGALAGLTPDEAFFVKCDRETNPSEGVDAGQVICEVGIAPVKPAEFVIFRLSQFSGGASLGE
jgi:uncharacterized protein